MCVDVMGKELRQQWMVELIVVHNVTHTQVEQRMNT